MASTPHAVTVHLDTTAIDKITAKWQEAFALVAKEREDLNLLVAYMADTDWSASEIARAVELPSRYADLLIKAQHALKATTDAAVEPHQHMWVRHGPGTCGGDPVWACDCGLWSGTNPLTNFVPITNLKTEATQ